MDKGKPNLKYSDVSITKSSQFALNKINLQLFTFSL